LKRAAEQAADRSAVSEAETQLREALTLLAAEPATPEGDVKELDLQSALGTLLANRSFAASERELALRLAYELCERIGNERETLAVLYQVGQSCVVRARFNEGRQVAERALTLVDRTQDDVLEAGAHDNLGECCFWSGDFRMARPHIDRALALCEGIAQPVL